MDKRLLWLEPLRDKTSNLTGALQRRFRTAVHPPRAIRRVFAVRMKMFGSVATYWAHSEVFNVAGRMPRQNQAFQNRVSVIQRIIKDTSAKKTQCWVGHSLWILDCTSLTFPPYYKTLFHVFLRDISCLIEIFCYPRKVRKTTIKRRYFATARSRGKHYC